MSNSIIIECSRTFGGNHVTFSAWEPYAGHGTFTHIKGERYGKVGTSRIPAELAALPAMSDERYERVHAWFDADKERAYAAIIAQYPEARDGRRDGMGEIDVVVRSGSSLYTAL